MSCVPTTKIDEVLGVRLSTASSSSDLDDVIREHEELLKRRLRQAQLRRMLLEEEAELRKLEQELRRLEEGDGGAAVQPQQPQNNLVASLVAGLVQAGLKPEQVKELLSDPAFLQSLALASAASNPQTALVIALAMLAQNLRSSQPTQTNGGVSAKDLKELLDAFKAGLDAARTVFSDGVREVIEKYLDKYDERLKRLEREIEETKKVAANNRGILDTILTDEKILNTIKKVLGVSDPRLELELKKLDLELEKMRLEHERELKRLALEARERRRQARMLVHTLKRIGESIADALSAIEEQRPLAVARCPKCGSQVTGRLGEVVECPKCGVRLRLVRRGESVGKAAQSG